MSSIGDNIRTLREALHLTQDELGEIADTNRVTIAKYESDRIVPGGLALIKLSKALHVPADVILGNGLEDMDAEYAEIWAAREAARRDPGRKLLFSMAKNASDKSVQQVVAIYGALKNTNSDVYDGDDPA